MTHDIVRTIDALERLLGEQCAGHEELLGLLRQKREAIRTASIDRITAICQREHRLVKRLQGLEEQRLAAVERLSRTLAPDEQGPLTLDAIAAGLDTDQAARLREPAGKLRAALETVRQESAVVSAAAEALNRHLAGIWQAVRGALNSAGVYERKGRLASSSQLDYCIDVKS